MLMLVRQNVGSNQIEEDLVFHFTIGPAAVSHIGYTSIYLFIFYD